MAVSVGVSADDDAARSDKCGHAPVDLARNPGHFVRTIWSCCFGRSKWPRRRRSASEDAARTPCARRSRSVHRSVYASEQRSGSRGVRRPSRTRCSICARHRARRCASLRPRCARPSGLDSACAQSASWLLRDGRRVRPLRDFRITLHTLVGPLIAAIKARHALDRHARCARQETHQVDYSARMLTPATTRSIPRTWLH